MKTLLLFIVWVFVGCCMAGESISNIRRNVVNSSDGSSEINSGINLNGTRKKVVGNGRIISKQIEVGAFSGLKVFGVFELEIKCGSSKTAVSVKADSNLIDLIGFKVTDGTLDIAFQRAVSTHNSPVITIHTGQLSALELSGSCDAKLSGIKFGKFKLCLTGSCRVDLSGSGVKDLRVILNGACSLDASKLVSKNNVIDLGGSSEALIRSSGYVEVKADGASELKYIGTPILKRQLSGAASVLAVEDK